MVMLPSVLVRHIDNPGRFEEQFLDYLEAGGFEVRKVAKTIAGTAYYQYVPTNLAADLRFFTGQVNETRTNMPTNNFVRPEGEHQVIYGIRLEEATNADETLLDWLPGAQTAFTKNSVFSIEVNGITKLKDYPCTEAIQDLTTRDIGFIPLQEPIIWGGQETMALVQSNKNGGSAAANSFIKYTLCAIGLI